MAWAPAQLDIDTLVALNGHITAAVGLSRMLADRWGVQLNHPAPTVGPSHPQSHASSFTPVDRLDHERAGMVPFATRGPPTSTPERAAPRPAPLLIPESTRRQNWRPQSAGADVDPGQRRARRLSPSNPSSATQPNYPPDLESARPSASQARKGDDDDDMSLDEMILNVADGDEPSDRNDGRPHRQGASQMHANQDHLFRHFTPPSRETTVERPKLRNNSNQHGQMRTLAHRVPQPLGEQPLSSPQSYEPKRHQFAQISQQGPPSSPLVPQELRYAQNTPVRATFAAQEQSAPRQREQSIAFAPLHGPDSMAAMVEEQRQQENHGRKLAPVGERVCAQCGQPGRYKDGRPVEKWGPGPEGPGTVCDRCRKKMKRVERRIIVEPNGTSGRSTPNMRGEPRESIDSPISAHTPHGLESNSSGNHQHASYTPTDPDRRSSSKVPSPVAAYGPPPFIARERDSQQDVRSRRTDWSRSDSHSQTSYSYAATNQLHQPVSDIRSEGSSGDNRSRGGRAREPGSRPRRRTPSFSPSRSPSPHSQSARESPPPSAQGYGPPHPSSSSSVRDYPVHVQSTSSPSINHPIRESPGTHPTPDTINASGSQALSGAQHASSAAPIPKENNISPIESDGTIVEVPGSATSYTAVSSEPPSALDPPRRPLMERSLSPSGARPPMSPGTTVLGKRRNFPEDLGSHDESERQRPKRHE